MLKTDPNMLNLAQKCLKQAPLAKTSPNMLKTRLTAARISQDMLEKSPKTLTDSCQIKKNTKQQDKLGGKQHQAKRRKNNLQVNNMIVNNQ